MSITLTERAATEVKRFLEQCQYGVDAVLRVEWSAAF
jgi:Fe-S cluster assembly iron-binding protein IscA